MSLKPPAEAYALVLQPSVPPEVLAWLDDHLWNGVGGTVYIACSAVAVNYPLVHLSALRNDDRSGTWEIALPIEYVLLILDWPDKEALPVGFHASPTSATKA